ncbi:hypothetical protein [Peribacillus butanolivorans]|uniref:hypothetical protein n=1 Tax=Peribacillus butanolivorans TaxID=421767 RepID=UPI0036DA1234
MISHPKNDISVNIMVDCRLDKSETAFIKIHGQLFDEGNLVTQESQIILIEGKVKKGEQIPFSLLRLNSDPANEHSYADISITISNETF